MREKFQKLMMGRYGVDQFTIFILCLSLLISFISSFTRQPMFQVISFLFILICYIRIFSRNITKRYEENEKFLKFWNPVKYQLEKKKSYLKSQKIYKYYKCPSCKQKIRVPKGKGKIVITCPKCRKEFTKKS